MNQQNSATPNFKPLAWPLYAVAAMLILIPLSELGGQLGWTVRPDQLNWRAGAVGILSGVVVTPTFGLLLAIVTAFFCGHRWVQRGLAILAGLVSVTLVALVVLFVLDTLQLLPIVTEQMQRSYKAAMLKALINLSVTIVTLAVICVGAFRAGRERGGAATAKKRATASDMPLVAGLSR